MKKQTRMERLHALINSHHERLYAHSSFFPLCSLISFGIALVISGYTFTVLNPQLVNKAELIPFSAPKQGASNLWLSIFRDKENLVIITADYDKFTWKLSHQSEKDILPFRTYLRNHVKGQLLTSSLRMKTNNSETMAMLSVDQRLQYYHILPVLYALAEERISTYGFETSKAR